MKRCAIVGLAIVLAAAGAAVPLPGRGPDRAQDAAQRVPRHDASAVVKLVAVRVLDRDGRPVIGLKKEDFVVTDNGARQVVTEFESYVLGESGVELVTAAKDASARAPLLTRRLFIFLDLQGSDVDGVKNAKAAALHFVDTQLRPDDEVGVIGFSPMRGFFIQEYLTTDHAKVRKAIERAKELPPGAGGAESAGPEDAGGRGGRGGATRGAAVVVDGGEARIGEGVDPGRASGGRGTGSLGSFSEVVGSFFVPGTGKYARTDFTPRMFDLAETLKYVPGNKSLVLFSGRDLGAAAKSLGQSFASSGTPIYAINTKNWIMRGVMTGVKEKHLYLEHSLKDLALASGGEYFADVEDIDRIVGEVQTMTGNFYVLGYYVTESWDGKFHKVGVELTDPGYRVLAQAGYFSPRPFADMTDFEKEVQLFGLLYAETPPAEALDLPAAEVGVVRAGGRDGVVLVEAAVDPKAGVSPARVEILALVRDEDRVPVVSRKWQLDLSSYNGKTLLLSFGSPAAPGKYDGRVVIRDVETGQPAAGRFSFEVPAPAGTGLVLSSPVLLAPGPATRLVRLETRPARRGQAAERTLVELYPFIPKDRRIVVRDIDAETGEIMALLPIDVSGEGAGGPPRVDVGAQLVPRSGGEAIPLSIAVADVKTTAEGHDFLVLRIALPRPAPGAYTLEISAEDAVSGSAASVRTEIVLK